MTFIKIYPVYFKCHLKSSHKDNEKTAMKPHANYLVTVKFQKTGSLEKEAKQLRAEKGQGKNADISAVLSACCIFSFSFSYLRIFLQKNVSKSKSTELRPNLSLI